VTVRHRALRGRVFLVLGAGERTARATALRLSAHGAAIVAAGPHPHDVVTTAGLVAASGGVARVIEARCPPLPVAELLVAAAAALEPPTDAVVCPRAFASPAAAAEAARDLAAALPASAGVHLLDADAPIGPEAERVSELFLAVRRR
jgi:NAD(P)-dependent dehydrogenase (short-subunit alcohol dehydrogenase family)